LHRCNAWCFSPRYCNSRPLARLKADGLGNHAFWLSSEIGTDALSLAESSGVRFISYKNIDGTHGELLNFLEDVKSFSGIVNEAPPVVSIDSSKYITEAIPSTKDLLVLSPNEQRTILNSCASRILSSENEKNYDKFEEFCKEYNRVIHAAGLFDTEPGFNKVLNYTLCSLEDSEGGFGTIWRAIDEEGNEVAIKVFKHEIRKNQNLLKAFRRGIRSLKILSNHDLPGIVKFKTACEIPPVLVMEWIEGVNLFTAVNQGKFRNWESRLRVACDLSNAIYRAHSVPERVLHRDIKPQNIMLRNFYQEDENAELIVLDFDLSWHVGALEKSVLAKGANPYLAPEQLTSQSEMTSRSAAVDAYGLGMTLYYLCTGSVPTPFMHQTTEWPRKLEQITNQTCKHWRSAPRRIARLIDLCTKHDQNLRPSFSQITADLVRLNNIIHGDFEHLDVKLFSEELAARTEAINRYQVDSDGTINWQSPTKRLKATIKPIDSDSLIIKFEFIQTGNEQFNSLATASELIAKSHTNFPATMFKRTPISTQQHGHYLNEIHINLDMSTAGIQLGILQKSLSIAMDKLMAPGS
jgi:serine/threonine protein kinase